MELFLINFRYNAILTIHTLLLLFLMIKCDWGFFLNSIKFLNWDSRVIFCEIFDIFPKTFSPLLVVFYHQLPSDGEIRKFAYKSNYKRVSKYFSWRTLRRGTSALAGSGVANPSILFRINSFRKVTKQILALKNVKRYI